MAWIGWDHVFSLSSSPQHKGPPLFTLCRLDVFYHIQSTIASYWIVLKWTCNTRAGCTIGLRIGARAKRPCFKAIHNLIGYAITHRPMSTCWHVDVLTFLSSKPMLALIIHCSKVQPCIQAELTPTLERKTVKIVANLILTVIFEIGSLIEWLTLLQLVLILSSSSRLSWTMSSSTGR
jgi:hypothetical protein